MGEVIAKMEMEHKIYVAAFMPIHEYIKRVLPYLEQRQELSKRFYDQKGKNEENDKNIIELINRLNDNISEILNIIQIPL